ncbi:MAG: pyridoxal phosphate-dependent aminotransferase [Planctomycetota bacterium]
MPISRNVTEALDRSSWIRRMFEEGARLRQEHGDDAVFDFSLGNPILPPPEALLARMEELVRSEGAHRYMPNAGWPEVRAKVAAHLERRTGIPYTAANVVMTVGAGGGLNVLFRAILNPGDEVIVLSPYFVEYGFYVQNAGGVLVEVQTTSNFGPPPAEALLERVTRRTKAVVINFPNNPTGRVYSSAELQSFCDAMRAASERIGTPILLITDEPYRKILYPGVECPEVPPAYDDTVLITSHSKDLGLAGDRIGTLAISPRIGDADELFAACTFCNRTLGFVSAPSLFQLAVADFQDASVDTTLYRENRRILVEHLRGLGFQFEEPGGAFYLFPKSPGENEIDFVNELLAERILVVPGRGFGSPGHFRISYAVPTETVVNSLPGWTRVAARHPSLSPCSEECCE